MVAQYPSPFCFPLQHRRDCLERREHRRDEGRDGDAAVSPGERQGEVGQQSVEPRQKNCEFELFESLIAVRFPLALIILESG